MAHSGPQSIPGVTLQEAYRFAAGEGDGFVEGTVFKSLPRRIVWEAHVDGTSIVVYGETRREAVEFAVAKAGPAAPRRRSSVAEEQLALEHKVETAIETH